MKVFVILLFAEARQLLGLRLRSRQHHVLNFPSTSPPVAPLVPSRARSTGLQRRIQPFSLSSRQSISNSSNKSPASTASHIAITLPWLLALYLSVGTVLLSSWLFPWTCNTVIVQHDERHSTTRTDYGTFSYPFSRPTEA
ncbi:hypothetical protein BJ508DRAFT_417791, partial [Ascobolus immersus RN42]